MQSWGFCVRSTAYSRPWSSWIFNSILDISLTFSRPTTLDTEAASTSQMFLPMKTRMHPDPALRKRRLSVHTERMVIGAFILYFLLSSFFLSSPSSLPLSLLLSVLPSPCSVHSRGVGVCSETCVWCSMGPGSRVLPFQTASGPSCTWNTGTWG